MDEELLLGFDTSDDAAVYRLRDDLAAVLTVDFFTPVVDDPYEYGAVAAANALSDVFAMGAQPLCALNILAFPCSLGTKVVEQVIHGGADKVAEAGAFVVGGHSIDDDEPKYGLAVFGTCAPGDIIRNQGAQPGDVLYCTKPLGTGLMNSALRAGLATEQDMRPVIDSMMELNRAGAVAMRAAGAHAATDITGFGLAGHLKEMLSPGVGARVEWDALPLFKDAYQLSCDYCRPGKSFDISEWATPFVRQGTMDDETYDNRMGVVCDPQTSGGLLVAVPPEQAGVFEETFREAAGHAAARIGVFTNDPEGLIALI